MLPLEKNMILVHRYMYLDHISFQREQSLVHQLRMTTCSVLPCTSLQEQAVFKINMSPTRQSF